MGSNDSQGIQTTTETGSYALHLAGADVMATILNFSKTARVGTPNTGETGRGSAELILFPGVRYERHEPEAQPKKRRRRAQTTHDVMDLPE